jgi:hypothetical protein
MHSAHFKNRGSLIRSELSARYQCSRERKGHGPIKIRIICNVSSEPRSSNLLQCPPSLPRNSARGGYGSGEGGGKSYIYPLVRYLMRDLLWKTREADRYFITLEDRN